MGIGRIGFGDGGIRVGNVLILVGYRLCRDVYLCYIYVALGFNCGLSKMEHAALIVMGPLGLPFLIYGIINYVIYFRFGGSSEVLDPSVHRFLCGHIC